LVPDVVYIMGDGSEEVASNVVDGFGWTPLSIDQLLRDEIASGSNLGQEIGDMFGEDRPIPIKIQVELLDRAMDNSPEDKFIVHDFPNTLQEALHFEKIVGGPAFILNMGSVIDPDQKAVIDFYRALAYVRDIDTSGPTARVQEQVNAHFIPNIQFVLSKSDTDAVKYANNARKLGYTILTPNDLLRAEIARESPDGLMIQKMLLHGQIVPNSVSLNLLGNIIQSASPRARFLIPTFPRALDQAKEFESTIAPVSGIVYLDMTDEEALKRAEKDETQPGKRLRVFQSQSLPVVNHYAAKGMCNAVDANKDEASITNELVAMFTPDIVLVVGPPGNDKDQVCARIQKDFRFTSVDFNEIMKKEMSRPTPMGIMLKSSMAKGQIVSNDTRVKLVMQAIQADGGDRFVVTNFPASKDQLDAFLQSIGKPLFILHLEATAENVKKSILTQQPEASEEWITTQVDSVASYSSWLQGNPLVRRINANFGVEHMMAEIAPHFCPVIVPLVGSSLSGKDTVATYLGLSHGFCRLDAKKLLEDKAKDGSPEGDKIRTYLQNGRTVPTALTLPLIREFILSSRTSKFLLDGYPRLVSAGYPMAHDQIYDIEDAIAPIAFAIHCRSDTERDNAKGVQHFEVETDTFAREYGPVLDYLRDVKNVVAINTGFTSTDLSIKAHERRALMIDSIADQVNALEGAPQQVLKGKYNAVRLTSGPY